MTRLLPTRAVYRPGEPIAVDVDGPGDLLVIRHLGDVVADVPADGSPVMLPPLPPGGYGVELVEGGAVVARTAVDVADDPRTRLRYGFVVDFGPGRDVAPVAAALRRLHLTGVQFYDWAYRHADLLGGGEQYLDALGQPVSLDTVRALVRACHAAGAEALGYAAVYGVGREEWPKWEHRALLSPGGEAYGLGDFLSLVDPAAPDWLEHFAGELDRAVAEIGFDGFHLDQYGYPKRSRLPDGSPVEVADSFVSMLAGVRHRLPHARNVFNNVNDFPTWATGRAATDAIYVEVWPPHVGLPDLAAVATRARSFGKPVVIAAYQHVYDVVPAATADLATSYTMATLFSHGATHLLCGEADRILVDPYYVRNHRAEASTQAMLTRWYDFLVEHGELLTDPSVVDVTGSYVGSYNDDLEVGYATTPVGHHAAPGGVWRRVVEAGRRRVVHLINLAGQPDVVWDAPRAEPGDVGPGTLRVRRSGPRLPRVRVADPDRRSHLLDVEVRADGDHAVAVLPPPRVWQMVVVEDEPA